VTDTFDFVVVGGGSGGCAVAGRLSEDPKTSVAVLDAGGNVAISPTGRHVAVLSAGAIQVFELPAPSPLPNTAGKQPGR